MPRSRPGEGCAGCPQQRHAAARPVHTLSADRLIAAGVMTLPVRPGGRNIPEGVADLRRSQMEQVQDAVVGEQAAEPAVGGRCAGEVADGSLVTWAPGVPAPRRGERGMVSAEWAVGIVAAVAIAGVLLAVVTSGAVKAALLGIVLKVLSTFLKFAH